MRLRMKFSLISAAIAVSTVTISLFLIFNFFNVIQVMEFQNKLFSNRYDYSTLISFTDRVRLRGIDMNTMETEWNKTVQSVDSSFSALAQNKIRRRFPANINSLVDSISSSWEAMKPQINIIGTHYGNITRAAVSSMFKNSVMQSGFTRAMSMYRETENVTIIEFEFIEAENQITTLGFANDNFNTIFAQVTVAINEFVTSQINFFGITAFVFSALASLLMTVIVVRAAKDVITRIRNMQKVTSMLSAKDLTSVVIERRSDEVSELIRDLNSSISSLDEFLSEVKQTARGAEEASSSINGAAAETASATHQISTNIESLKKQFDMLDKAVEKSTKALGEISSIAIRLVNDNDQQSAMLTESNAAISAIAQTVDHISSQAVQKVQSAEEIRNLVADGDEKMLASSSLLNEISSQLDEITEVVTIINTIAEQTNILSMNAAIESAHAGESGKGFGVVAEEIRNLAESTAENAKRIGSSIYSIITNVKDANETSDAAGKAFSRVSEQAKDMMMSLRDITESIRSVDEKTRHINGQTRRIEESSRHISEYCTILDKQQRDASSQMESMHNMFSESLSGIDEIRIGTEDIVSRMSEVSTLSTDNYQQMAKLSSSLKEFKTSAE